MALNKVVHLKLEAERNTDYECTACGEMFMFGSQSTPLLIPLGRDHMDVQKYAIVHDDSYCINVVR